MASSGRPPKDTEQKDAQAFEKTKKLKRMYTTFSGDIKQHMQERKDARLTNPLSAMAQLYCAKVSKDGKNKNEHIKAILNNPLNNKICYEAAWKLLSQNPGMLTSKAKTERIHVRKMLIAIGVIGLGVETLANAKYEDLVIKSKTPEMISLVEKAQAFIAKNKDFYKLNIDTKEVDEREIALYHKSQRRL